MFRVLGQPFGLRGARGLAQRSGRSSSLTLSEHIPEHWEVRGAISPGWTSIGDQRSTGGPGGAHHQGRSPSWFEVHGQAVLFPGHRGERFIWQDGRADVFY
ncbi:MAG: hypothetical protein R2810_16780 [Flavobacteriales bacterium]